MHDHDIKTTLADFAHTFEEFKTTSQDRLSMLEKKGHTDNLIEDKLERLNSALDKTEIHLKQLETARLRPDSEDSIRGDSDPYQEAFLGYVRKGIEGPLQGWEGKSLSSMFNEEGGYFVPTHLHHQMQTILSGASTVRSLANVKEISTDAIELLIDKDTAEAGWVAQTAERPETRSPKIEKIRIPVHEMYAKPRATQKLLDDASINVESWLSEKIAQKMTAIENQAFLFGDGNNKPKGIFAYESAEVDTWSWGKLPSTKTKADGAFKDDGAVDTLVEAFHRLKPQYLTGACWLMSRSTQMVLRKLRDRGSQHFLWQPPLTQGAVSTLLGHPVVICDDMPSLVVGTPSKSILFGNLKHAYQIVDRTGLRVLRDPYSAKPYVEFYATRRVGGDMLNFEALQVIDFSA